ncbi:TatD family hydrolase [Nocardioides convexus]|uniref:TatD family hydrolase n=1 Tax=Nocardioides convexus TaxID=2712224 RepID=UPI003100ABA5
MSGASEERPPVPEPLPHPVVDNHCHLDIGRGGEPWATEEALAAAAAVGVRRIVQIGCDLPGARWAVAAAAEHDALVAGVALHPNEAPRIHAEGGRPALEAAWEEIEQARRRARQGARGGGDRAGRLPHRRGGPGRAGGVLRPARRHRQAARQDPGHP